MPRRPRRNHSPIFKSKGNKELTRKAFTYKSKINGKKYSDMVAALSKLTVELAGKITHVIAMQK
jgi:hypothetical protein